MVFFYHLLSRLPLCLVHAIGALLGRLTYLGSPTYRRNLKANMAQAGIDPALRRKAIAEAGKQAIEVSHIWLRSQQEAVALVVDIDGLEHVLAAQRSGKGIIYLTPHLGCFEITGQYLSTLAEFTALYRPPRYEGLRTMIEAGRRRPQLHLAPADLSGVRSLVKALKKGQAVCLLPDQTPQVGEGVWLDFFGSPAYTMTLAARLSETGATVILMWGERLPGGRGFKLHFRLPLAEITGDTVARAQRINQEMEALIREKPEQYLWGYNRYKRPAGAEAPPCIVNGERGSGKGDSKAGEGEG